MKLKFSCKICKQRGPFVHAYWYSDEQGLEHGLLYCRSCGGVHESMGSSLGVIKLLMGRLPAEVIAVYDRATFQKLLKIGNPDFINRAGLPGATVEAMIADGRLLDEDLVESRPATDLLLECLADPDPIVRREAIVALTRFQEKHCVEPLIEALKDENWDVRRSAAIALGELGDSQAKEPLSELLNTETREHLVREEAAIALKKLES
jgi:HEAT repeat protein